MNEFHVVSEYAPSGDQPQAIDKLAQGVLAGDPLQTLLGVTGSGKTFTMAKVIERVQKPTLILAHNKTLAAQLCGEFKEYFPDSAVEFFVSYYDYYQPEAYIAASDTYIEKTVDINDEIDRLRYSATCALNERRDVIIVSSVSCIYALGDPVEYMRMSVSIRKGMAISRDEVMHKLVDIQFQRNDFDFARASSPPRTMRRAAKSSTARWTISGPTRSSRPRPSASATCSSKRSASSRGRNTISR